jgi:uncharacterized MAPEG superfamily protein
METAYTYLALSGILTVLLWTPYILARVFVWGLPTFLNNYPEGFPAKSPEPPLWAQCAHRAHLNMVETLPALIAVVVAAGFLVGDTKGEMIGHLVQIFFFARIAHAIVYTLGIPYLRTPVYLVSWASVLAIGYHAIS